MMMLVISAKDDWVEERRISGRECSVGPESGKP